MAKLVMSPFCGYEFTSGEELQRAQIFSPQNTQWIQATISSIAIEKLHLNYDPVNPQGYMQKQAELQGQLNILRYLLDCSESALKALTQPSQE